jgi:hypothetical protein
MIYFKANFIVTVCGFLTPVISIFQSKYDK